MEFRTISDLKKYLSMLEQKRHHPEDYVIGIEMEGALVDAEGKPLDVKDLIPKLNSIYHDFEFDKEAGACQLEIRTFPRKFSTESLREKEEYFLDVVEEIVEQAERVHKTEAIFLLLGSNPHPDVLSDRWITSSQRAKTMAEWRREFPEVKIAGKTIRPEHVATAIQSMHIHIQGVSPDDVADKYNHLLYMVPGQIAISANSPIIGGELVDYAEARLLLYEMADGGNAGLPKHRTYPQNRIPYISVRENHLQRFNILCSWPLIRLLQIKLHLLAYSKAHKSVLLNIGVVDKNILLSFHFDEAVSLFVYPFYNGSFHIYPSLTCDDYIKIL